MVTVGTKLVILMHVMHRWSLYTGLMAGNIDRYGGAKYVLKADGLHI